MSEKQNDSRAEVAKEMGAVENVVDNLSLLQERASDVCRSLVQKKNNLFGAEENIEESVKGREPIGMFDKIEIATRGIRTSLDTIEAITGRL